MGRSPCGGDVAPDPEARGRDNNVCGGESAGHLIAVVKLAPKPCFGQEEAETGKGDLVHQSRTPEKGGVRAYPRTL
jgi:hypothetical protein